MPQASVPSWSDSPEPVSTLAVDPFSAESLAEPEPVEEMLRQAGPVVYLPAIEAYAVARHAEVEQVLGDWQRFESGQGVGLSNFRKVPKWRGTSAVLEADPPAHDAPRRVLESVLGAATQRQVRKHWMRAADELVEALVRTGRPVDVDGVRDLALAFPLRVVPDAIGIPEEGREQLVPFSDLLLNLFGPRNELVRNPEHDGTALSAWVDGLCTRETYSEGSWGAAIWRACDDGELMPEQAPLVMRSLFAAGVNSTVHALATLLECLSGDPNQWDIVRSDPRYLTCALDEAVRWRSPIRSTFRTTRGPAPVGTAVLPDNAKVLVCVGAAQRDPLRWEDPASFDVTRQPGGHLGFGAGIHACVGQHLARLEAECLLQALTRRVERIEPAGEPVRRPNNTLNALSALPLRLHPR